MDNSTIILIITLLLMVAVYAILKKRGTAAVADDHHDGEDGVCCGRHTVCTHGYDNSNLYFDDEELDRFREKPQEEYTDEEVEEFRNVLYTMKPEEVDLWVKCLQTRHIELPAQIKDEILLMLQ